MRAGKKMILLGCLLLLCASVSAEPWVLVDTRADKLTVIDENGPLEVFDNIALGVRGAARKHRRGDETTPVGSFKVTHFNPASRFHLFIGLDYPNLEHAQIAYWEKRIDQKTYERIISAIKSGKPPPQDTPLGGYIGIHGVGAGDPRVHANFNWTNGCVAVSNEQIVRLAKWIKIGTRVEIR